MVNRYQITYVLLSDPYRMKRNIWKFGKNVDDLEKTFHEYVKEPALLIQVQVSDEED